MKKLSQCNLCNQKIAKSPCISCGNNVCESCYIGEKGICKICHQGRK